MTVHDALGDYFERRGVKPVGESVDEWLAANWFYVTLFAPRRTRWAYLRGRDQLNYGFDCATVLRRDIADVRELSSGRPAAS